MTKTITCLFFLVVFLFSGGINLVQASSRAISLNHISAGFAINTVARVDNAASLGVNTAIIYGQAYTPSDPVGAEMLAKGMHEIDAGISSQLFYYECHRTHTVARPPHGKANTYCATDVQPSVNSQKVVLANIDALIKADKANPLVIGYWVLDDWAYWDGGSAKTLLQTIRTHIQQYTPANPAICGFGFEIGKPKVNTWSSFLAQNYSNTSCDMISFYAYASGSSSPSNASQFDFSMKATLPAAFSSLKKFGWSSSQTPLLGIAQAFGGPIAAKQYVPGITSLQMKTEANAFCQAGAVSISWYGWADSEFTAKTLTPMTSSVVRQGIRSSIAACKSVWSKKK